MANWFYVRAVEASASSTAVPRRAGRRRCVVFDDGVVGSTVGQALAALGHAVIYGRPGEEPGKVSDSTFATTVSPEAAPTTTAMCSATSRAGAEEPIVIAHCWTVSAESTRSTSAQRLGLFSLLALVRRLRPCAVTATRW